MNFYHDYTLHWKPTIVACKNRTLLQTGFLLYVRGMNPLTITIGQTQYVVVAHFGDDRAIINYDGAFVLVDRDSTGQWDLSGQPARLGPEQDTLKALLAQTLDQTVVTVTKDP